MGKRLFHIKPNIKLKFRVNLFKMTKERRLKKLAALVKKKKLKRVIEDAELVKRKKSKRIIEEEGDALLDGDLLLTTATSTSTGSTKVMFKGANVDEEKERSDLDLFPTKAAGTSSVPADNHLHSVYDDEETETFGEEGLVDVEENGFLELHKIATGGLSNELTTSMYNEI